MQGDNEISRFQQLSGDSCNPIWSVGQSRQGRNSANKSIEESSYQSHRHIDK